MKPYYQIVHCPNLHEWECEFVWEHGHPIAMNENCRKCHRDFIGAVPVRDLHPDMLTAEVLREYLTEKEFAVCVDRALGEPQAEEVQPFDKDGPGEKIGIVEAMRMLVEYKRDVALGNCLVCGREKGECVDEGAKPA